MEKWVCWRNWRRFTKKTSKVSEILCGSSPWQFFVTAQSNVLNQHPTTQWGPEVSDENHKFFCPCCLHSWGTRSQASNKDLSASSQKPLTQWHFFLHKAFNQSFVQSSGKFWSPKNLGKPQQEKYYCSNQRTMSFFAGLSTNLLCQVRTSRKISNLTKTDGCSICPWRPLFSEQWQLIGAQSLVPLSTDFLTTRHGNRAEESQAEAQSQKRIHGEVAFWTFWSLDFEWTNIAESKNNQEIWTMTFKQHLILISSMLLPNVSWHSRLSAKI